MRTRLPALRTLPSNIVLTFSCWPIQRMSSFFPLNAKLEVRAGTRRPFNREKAIIRSSVRPSLKYSFSWPELMLTKGRTAMDFPVTEILWIWEGFGDPVNLQWLLDILECHWPHSFQRFGKVILDLVKNLLRNTNAARTTQWHDASSDVDAIANHVVSMTDNIARM